MTTRLETDRLLLRPWTLDDAASLYEVAKDPLVGPPAGWPPHKSVDDSREVIAQYFLQDGCFAVTLKDDDNPIGMISLICGHRSNLPIPSNEGEISYWIGSNYWGQGLIPEAMRAVIQYGFEQLNLTTQWCGYYEGNEKSKRVQEKCGFRWHHKEPGCWFPLTDNDQVEENVSRLTQVEWVSIL